MSGSKTHKQYIYKTIQRKAFTWIADHSLSEFVRLCRCLFQFIYIYIYILNELRKAKMLFTPVPVCTCALKYFLLRIPTPDRRSIYKRWYEIPQQKHTRKSFIFESNTRNRFLILDSIFIVDANILKLMISRISRRTQSAGLGVRRQKWQTNIVSMQYSFGMPNISAEKNASTLHFR